MEAQQLHRMAAGSILRVLHGNNAFHNRTQPTDFHAVGPEAQEAFWRGLMALAEYTQTLVAPGPERQAGLRAAITFIEEATDLAPGWAEAHAHLARAYHLLASGYRAHAREFYPKSKAAALRAIALDSLEAQAYASLGFVQFAHEPTSSPRSAPSVSPFASRNLRRPAGAMDCSSTMPGASAYFPITGPPAAGARRRCARSGEICGPSERQRRPDGRRARAPVRAARSDGRRVEARRAERGAAG